MLNIGGVELPNPFIMAPLAGITDAVMRSLCEEQGAALTYTEMVSAKGLCYGDRKTPKLLYIPKNAGLTGVQIFGSEPKIIGQAAKMLNSGLNCFLDINMGCPVPKVVRNGDGSALMKNPDCIYEIVSAAVANTDKPVTVKMRKSFDENSSTAVECALAAEAGGAAMVTVHGRTREQYYQGKADWDIIRQVKETLHIPVVGNGDVTCGEDALRMMKETGCDGVMIGRGALGNPWIFDDVICAYEGRKFHPPTWAEKSEMMIRHYNGLVKLKGEYSAVREMRKHIGWYTKGYPGAAKLRGRVNDITDGAELREVLKLENPQNH